MSKKVINSITVSLANLPKTGGTRTFTVIGEKGAAFMLQVIRTSDSAFYDFDTRSFSTGFSLSKNLKKTLTTGKYSSNILFPSVVSETDYNILLFPDPNTDTELTSNRNVINLSVSQIVNSTVSIVYKTSNTNKYSSNPPATTLTSQGNPVKKYKTSIDLTATTATSANDGHAYGLRLIRQPRDTDFVFEASTTVDGAVSPASKDVVLASIDDLVPGMVLVSGASSGTPVIKRIDKLTKTVTLSAASTFGGGAAVKFEAQGPKMIFSAIGLGISLNKLSATAEPLTKTIRATGSNAVIALNNTKGVSGGGFVGITGPNVVNTSANTIQSVAEDPDGGGADGTITVQVAQTTDLAVGTVIKFKGCTEQINIAGNAVITSYPSANKTINFKLDNFITPGQQTTS